MPNRSEDALDSWKGIAAYLKRGVRTVRRWEREEGLPVHRQMHHTLGSVYAYRSEIDSWRDRRELVGARRIRRRSVTRRSEEKSILVLPFANLSRDSNDEYVADGLTAEVIADLSQVEPLRVISRTSSSTLKGSSKDVRTIASELGIRYVVEGSVLRSGDRLKVRAQLIDAETDDHLWADKYEGSTADVFAIQERVARMIVDALQLRLTADADRRLAARPIHNLHAYECYLRARHQSWRWREDAINDAIRLLQNGLTIVGDNAQLFCALGLAHLQHREAGVDFSERPLLEAERCADRVFALDPRSPSAFQLRGWIHYSRGRIQDAVRDLKQAVSLDQGNTDALQLLINCYMIAGRVPESRPLLARLLAIDPLTPLTHCMPGFADALEGRPASAIAAYRRMFEMDPGNPMARLFYIEILAANRRFEEIPPLVATLPQDARDSVVGRLTLMLAAAAAGRSEEIEAAMTPQLAAATTATDLFSRQLAHTFALAGMFEQAFPWLDNAVERGFTNYPYLAYHDPYLAPYRGEPRLVELLAKVHARWQAFEA